MNEENYVNAASHLRIPIDYTRQGRLMYFSRDLKYHEIMRSHHVISVFVFTTTALSKISTKTRNINHRRTI